MPEEPDPSVGPGKSRRFLVGDQPLEGQELCEKKWRRLAGLLLALLPRALLGLRCLQLLAGVYHASVGVEQVGLSPFAGQFEEAQGSSEALVEGPRCVPRGGELEVVQRLRGSCREGPVPLGQKPAAKRPPVADPLVEGVGALPPAAAQGRWSQDPCLGLGRCLGKGEVSF